MITILIQRAKCEGEGSYHLIILILLFLTIETYITKLRIDVGFPVAEKKKEQKKEIFF